MTLPGGPIPLSASEREDFGRLFERRLAKVTAKTADVFAFRDMHPPPFIVNSAMYWVLGLDPETFPHDYFDDPEVMTAFQERAYYEQIRAIEDDFVPYLMPWFGTVVLASAFGSRVEFPPKQDPAINPRYYPVKTVEDVKRLRIPDPEQDGLMPVVLKFLRHMRRSGTLPVGITDCQGPLTTANQLMGYDQLIYLMHDAPEAAHELLDKLTESLILWIRKQKEVIGEAINECIGDQQIYLGQLALRRSHGGLWIGSGPQPPMVLSGVRFQHLKLHIAGSVARVPPRVTSPNQLLVQRAAVWQHGVGHDAAIDWLPRPAFRSQPFRRVGKPGK